VPNKRAPSAKPSPLSLNRPTPRFRCSARSPRGRLVAPAPKRMPAPHLRRKRCRSRRQEWASKPRYAPAPASTVGVAGVACTLLKQCGMHMAVPPRSTHLLVVIVTTHHNCSWQCVYAAPQVAQHRCIQHTCNTFSVLPWHVLPMLHGATIFSSAGYVQAATTPNPSHTYLRTSCRLLHCLQRADPDQDCQHQRSDLVLQQ
jgi:hypothetical protein